MQLRPETQYGFRLHNLTAFAALEIVDRIITQLDNNQLPLSIFIGLLKAFDTLDY